MQSFSGSPSFNCFRAKTNRARARRHCGLTTTASDSSSTSRHSNNLRFLDQIDRTQLLRYVKFLREHDSDLDDRTVHNIFETLNTFLRTRDIFIAGKILAELDYAEKPPKPYTKHELKAHLCGYGR